METFCSGTSNRHSWETLSLIPNLSLLTSTENHRFFHMENTFSYLHFPFHIKDKFELNEFQFLWKYFFFTPISNKNKNIIKNIIFTLLYPILFQVLKIFAYTGQTDFFPQQSSIKVKKKKNNNKIKSLAFSFRKHND